MELTTTRMASLTALSRHVSPLLVTLARFARVPILLTARKLVTVRGISAKGTAVVPPILQVFNQIFVGALSPVQLWSISMGMALI